MAFGLSFGAKKSKGSSSTTVNKTEAVNSTETGTKSSTGTTTGTSATQTAEAGSSASQQATTQATTGSQTSQNTTSLFSAGTLAALESAAQGLLGNVGQVTADMKYASDFDVGSFVQAGVDAAANRLNTDRDTNINAMYDSYGGRDDSNSMVALLENRTRGDTEASLAGVRAALEQQGRGIARDDFLANVQGQGQASAALQNVLDSLKGGLQTSTGAVQTAEQMAGTQTGAQQFQQTGSSATQTAEQTALIEQLQNIINGTTVTTGTEKTKSKGSEVGGGASLSL